MISSEFIGMETTAVEQEAPRPSLSKTWCHELRQQPLSLYYYYSYRHAFLTCLSRCLKRCSTSCVCHRQGGGARTWTLDSLRTRCKNVRNRVAAEGEGRGKKGCCGGQAAGEREGEQGRRDVGVLLRAVFLAGQR